MDSAMCNAEEVSSGAMGSNLSRNGVQRACRAHIPCNQICHLKRELKVPLSLEQRQLLNDDYRALVTFSTARWMENLLCCFQHDCRQGAYPAQ